MGARSVIKVNFEKWFILFDFKMITIFLDKLWMKTIGTLV